MTGRGTPYGLDVAPVIKVCSRNEMKDHWFDLIDISAGHIATGEATIADVAPRSSTSSSMCQRHQAAVQ